MGKINLWKNSKAIKLYAVIAIVVITSFQGYWLYTVYESKQSIIIRESENILRTAVLDIDSKTIETQLLDNRIPHTAEVDDVTRQLLKALKLNKDIKVKMEVAGVALSDSVSQEMLDKLSQKPSVWENNKSKKVYLAIKDEIAMAFDGLQFAVHYSKKQQSDSYPKLTAAFDAETQNIRTQFDTQQQYSLRFANMKMVILGEMLSSIILSVLFLVIYISAIILLFVNVNKSRKLMEQKDNFTSNMTHEFKTPMATISAAIEALSKYDVLDDKAMTKEYLALMKGDLDRLINMTDSILNHAKTNNGEIALVFEPTELKAYIKDLIDHLKPVLDRKDASVRLYFPDDAVFVNADHEHFGNVLRNLIDNAIKYSNSSPMIDITLLHQGNFVKILFADNGIGIPEKYRNEIFKPYFRVLENHTYTTKGYGLGLSYIKQIINLHHGKIQLVPKQHNGTTFEILIPLHHE